MPTRETNITYFFPTTQQSKLDAIEMNKAEGRMWVSTSLQGGRMRMKFCTIDNVTDPHKPTYYVSAPDYAKLVPYAGKERT